MPLILLCNPEKRSWILKKNTGNVLYTWPLFVAYILLNLEHSTNIKRDIPIFVQHWKQETLTQSVTWVWTSFTFSICSFSAANSETEPKTNLNSLRYRLESSRLEPISGRRSRRYSTRIVANRAEVVGFAKKELATICQNKERMWQK